MPPKNTSSAVITFRDLVMRNFMNLSNCGKDNFSQDEKHAIKEMAAWEDIIIKPSDKGGNIVIWPRVVYLTEALKQLNDTSCYQKLPRDPTIHFRTLSNNLITEGLQTRLITKNESKALFNNISVTLTFYVTKSTQEFVQTPRSANCVRQWQSM